jgi:hypothetical protein
MINRTEEPHPERLTVHRSLNMTIDPSFTPDGNLFEISGEDGMALVQEIESAILDDLIHSGPCTMDELVCRLPHFTWNQVFSVLDRLSREGKLHIKSRRRFEYVVTAVGHSPSLREAQTGAGCT